MKRVRGSGNHGGGKGIGPSSATLADATSACRHRCFHPQRRSRQSLRVRADEDDPGQYDVEEEHGVHREDLAGRRHKLGHEHNGR